MDATHQLSISLPGRSPEEFQVALDFELRQEGRVLFEALDEFEVPVLGVPSAGAKMLFISLEALTDGGDVEVRFGTAAAGEGVTLSPGGLLFVAIPTPTSGPGAITLVASGPANVQYKLLG